MMGMEVESMSGLLQQTLISFVQNFLFSCPLLSTFLRYSLASSLFVTFDILYHFRAGVPRAAGNTPFFPRLSKLLICFLEIPPSSALGYKWLRLKILPSIHLIIVSCFPFKLGLGLCIARGASFGNLT